MASKRSATAPSRFPWLLVHIALCLLGCALFLFYQFGSNAEDGITRQSTPHVILPTSQTSERTGLKFKSVPYDSTSIEDLRFGIIFDAGSTGSRVHIYRFRMTAGVPLLEDEIFVEVKPGLSAYVPQGVGSDASTRDVGQTKRDLSKGPDAAAESLRSLMELCVEQIPPSHHARTPISLRATAGLRLLGQSTAESILASIRTLFAQYPFPHLPTDIEVMNGSEEGVFAWITVNYLESQLHDTGAGVSSTSHPQTSAILDLGGASTQIVFEPDSGALQDLPKQDLDALYTLPYGARTYKLFETSYLGYGLMEARRRTKHALREFPLLEIRPKDGKPGVMYHPCLSDVHSEVLTAPAADSSQHSPSTTTILGHAAGFASCAEIVRTLFPKHPVAPCTRSSCSFGGHFALPLSSHARSALIDPARGRIYAFSYFYDRTLEIFELEEESSAQSTSDGTILRVERLRHLAETICSFSMAMNVVRSPREIQEEKDRSLAEKVKVLGAKGCRIVKVRRSDGVEEERILSDTPSEVDLDQGECMIEEKPDLSHPNEHAQISSPFVALLSENPYLCLDLTYAHTLLHYGYDLPESTDLHIMKRLQKKEIGWCLGAMLSQMAQRGW